ncbi:hypothetical protein FRC12_010790 [Ceratobasidium sp. 428]|nr:hypothetical protein FRC12_010790 [Ceratobasidium sp. 428]
MALLAEYHCGVGEKDAGYMFMGMSFQAVRFCEFPDPLAKQRSPHIALLSVIGRNDRDITPNEGVIAFPESINRSWHFWSAFGYDKLMAIDFDFEYEVHIPRSGISHPLVDDELDNQPWLLESPSTSLTNIPYANLITATFYESCKLMIITTEIIDTVHRRKKQALEERIVIDTHLRLDTWFNELPDKLTIRANSASPLPHVIMLHICYWWLLIILHQPPIQNVSTEVEAKLPSIEGLSTKIRDRAGHKIVQLLKMFDRQHGLRFFPRNMIEAICACGTALLWEYTSTSAAAQKKRSNAIDGVGACVTALRTISVTWPYAQTRADDLEARLQKHFPPEFIMTQVDDPSLNPSHNLLEEQGLDDFTDISSELQQYMNEWHVLPFEVSQSSGLSSEMFGPEPSNHQE